ncbi:unnamed protein product [Parascedosporium putredinis]|uniref:TPX2 C-terminal domain-containing protein n=1 Tax=Parascedosporium putredinis TaxID=1442378 RepID=A0A9P1ME96_9PEZI|nr:unnamed protein product [Parascedosporium putredinis]CAI8001149.1 unnamed protein product [Parascedosporium putredinis]
MQRPISVNGFTRSVTSSPAAPKILSIEDSLEALDRLEEELEAVNAVTHFGRVPSPRFFHWAVVQGGAQHSSSERVRVPRTRQRQLRDPAAAFEQAANDADFRVAWEAIARKLKEKKEARLSMQLEVGKSPAAAIKAATPQRTRSTRVLPRPTFELPGEAISRRKREQREAQIRAQEEEEQKRREFKARPIMAGLRQPSSAPRETVASRARQTKVSQMENGAAMSASMKRLSLAATQSPLMASSQSRGRAVATSPSQLSRATSVAASSVSGSGKRSTISAEDAAQHKVRGKEILARDNRYANDRERGRAEREVLAKLAREQAAERSRQLSREWAEKQRRKAASAGTTALTR